ncbi:MAG: hypothetical protein AAF529_06395 [Pseudomonadota bacterium]
MDPIQALKNALGQWLPSESAASAAVESQLKTLFDKYTLVPRHEYEAHLDILTTLQNQVHLLEARLAELEQNN